MRLYSFTSMYMEGIHAGIQTAHLVSVMSAKYPKDSREYDIFQMWATRHKTIFVSNGGMAWNLRQRYQELQVKASLHTLPVAQFHESRDALDGALTAIGIIVPEYLYSPRSVVRDDELYAILNDCDKAR